ncbi:MAG: sugar-binding transcriptional regulator [Actinobacteria bacterium]|nr:sugar-binding transcriptional regulator [Actinomycetota bacterium]
MLGRVARLYYEYDLTHQEIADLLGVSRIRVTRALAEARRVGIVTIEVHTDEGLFIAEENALADKYDLDHVWVAPTNSANRADPIAHLAADCIVHLITNGMRIGVGLSTTLALAVSYMKPSSSVSAEFIPLQGTNPGLVVPPTPSNIALELAHKFGGSSHDLAVPVLPQARETAMMLRSEPDVQRVFDMARTCDLALVGVGGSTPGSSIMLTGTLTKEQADELKAAGAVGDINAHFFDKDGSPVDSPVTDLVLALNLESFSMIPVRVGIAGGPDKVEALRGALRGNLLNGLVTDIETAQRLIAE